MTDAPAARRRLLFISHSREVGGAEVYLLNVLRHVSSSGRWEARLVCRRDAAVDTLATGAAKVVDVVRLDVTRPRDVGALRALIRDSDAVHLNLAFPSGKYQLASALMVKIARRPLVVTHHLALRVPAQWRLFMRWLGRAAARHIAISDAARRFLLEEFGYPAARVVTVHNGVDADVYQPSSAAARAEFRKAAGVGDALLGCTVARLSPQKGLGDLLEALAIAAKQVRGLHAVLIGEGELRGELERRAHELELEQKVSFLGSVRGGEVAQWLAAADIFILPSRYEGGPPLALMEAMASGCPPVATDVTGVRELITEPSLGSVVPVGDPAQLAAAVIGLSDPTRRAAMSGRARQAVLTNFTIEASMRKTLSVIEDAVAAHG